jgi:hypothetical protein
MAKSNHDGSLSALGALSVMCCMTAALFLVLYWLMQPKVLQNPGMASYQPPVGTRLEPLPRKSDAPELAALPENPRSSFAEAIVPSDDPPKPAKPEARERPKKPAPVRPRRNPEGSRSYAQQQWGPAYSYGQQRPASWSWF